jgi:hypothetical protein
MARGFLFGLGSFLSLMAIASAIGLIALALLAGTGRWAPADGDVWQQIEHGGLILVFSLPIGFLVLRMTRVPDRPWGLYAIWKWDQAVTRTTLASRGFPPDPPDTTKQAADRSSGYPPVIGWLSGVVFGALFLNSAVSLASGLLDSIFR